MRPCRALTVMLTALTVLAFSGTTTATAHGIDVRLATEMTRERAQTLGSVTWAACWRKPAAIHVRSRHRAVCVASVETASSGPCLVVYEVHVGGRSSRALSVAQSGAPRCVNQTPGTASG
jgi:hypothetical protein